MRVVRSLVVLLALAALGLAVARTEEQAEGVRAGAIRAAGSLSLSNSRDNAAIFTASALRPGRAAQGTVTIRNTGTLSGRLALTQTSVTDSVGPGGGRLSNRLQLTVRDLASSADLYSGAFASMPRSDTGSIAPGQSRAFRLTASLPDGGVPPSPNGGDNAYRGSSASVRYVWTATAFDSGTPAPKPAPAPQPVPARAPCRPSLRVPGGQRLLRRRRMVARVRVTRACRVTVYAYARNRSGRARFLRGLRNKTLAAGPTYRVTLRLAPAVRRILRSRRRKVVAVRLGVGSRVVGTRVRVR